MVCTAALQQTGKLNNNTDEENQYLLLLLSCIAVVPKSDSEIKRNVNIVFAGLKMLFPATLLLPVMTVMAEVSIGTLPAEMGSCDLLDGVFVSVMRRIFSPGFHKVI